MHERCMKDIYSVTLRPWLEHNERLFEFQHRGFSCFVLTKDDVEQPQILKYEENDFCTQASADNKKKIIIKIELHNKHQCTNHIYKSMHLHTINFIDKKFVPTYFNIFGILKRMLFWSYPYVDVEGLHSTVCPTMHKHCRNAPLLALFLF